jgi:DNA-binding IclR family transcriptional regulator
VADSSRDNSLRYKTLSDFSRILGLFEEQDVEERGVSDIARALSMLPSKVSRMLKTLETDGWVERNGRTGKYRVGVRFLRVGLLYVLNHPLRRLILPHVEQMARDLGLLSGWGIFKNDKIIVVDRIRMKKGPLIHLLGSEVPVHSSSYGKVFLAYMSSDERDVILRSLPLPRFTGKTIGTIDAMREELMRVRAQGFSVDDEETRDGVTGLGAPVFGDQGELLAAITVSGDTTEFSPGKTAEARYLVDKALFISRQVGYKITE